MAAFWGALVAACTPQTQVPLDNATARPMLADDHVISFDGARLALQVWPATDGAPWAVVLAVHGMSEYAEAFYLAAPYWAERGVTVYAFDQRGFGRSPGRGVWPGAELMGRDVATVAAQLRARHPDVTLAVLGESMGAASVLAAIDQADAALADRVVLSAPGVRGWSALPLHYKSALWVSAHIAPRRAVRPPRGVSVQASDNMEALYKNGRDPLYLRDTRIDAVYGLISHMEAASRTVAGVAEPTLVLYGAKDELIPQSAVEVFAAKLGPKGRSAFYDDGWHMLLRDLQAEVVWNDVLAFLRDPHAELPSGAPSLGAQDAEGR